MKSGALVFITVLACVTWSWCGFVLAPQVQLGGQPTNAVSGEMYPLGRPGMAREGLEVYRANGCVYCHSQELRQDGARCELVLTEVGTNAAAVNALIAKISPGSAKDATATLPKVIREVPGTDVAKQMIENLGKIGAKAEVHVIGTGADMERAGWGRRRSVAQDFIYDTPVQPGVRRVGPDLANIGQRSDVNWHYQHLYAPRTKVEGSVMPPYRYLFETRKVGREATPDALQLTGDLAPRAGYEIVPKPEARALVAYLMSLRSDVALFEAPATIPNAPSKPAATNAPPAKEATK